MLTMACARGSMGLYSRSALAKEIGSCDALGQHCVDGDASARIGDPVLLPVEERELARAQDPARADQPVRARHSVQEAGQRNNSQHAMLRIEISFACLSVAWRRR